MATSRRQRGSSSTRSVEKTRKNPSTRLPVMLISSVP